MIKGPATSAATTMEQIDMSSSDSGLPMISAAASSAVPALPPQQNQHLGNEPPNNRQIGVNEETPPLLPRCTSHQAGPNRPLPASPTRQKPAQRCIN